jgi:organic hydroperoxide reductase OsmC/OhrA
MTAIYTASATATGDGRNGRSRVGQITADGLAEAAHLVCPYSNATRGNIQATVDTIVA